MFYAVDNNGNKFDFIEEKKGNSTFFTLKKENFKNATTIEVKSDLITAKAGEEGFYIVPRHTTLLGDIYTKFTEKEDSEFVVQAPIMACCAVKTERFCGLIRYERNYVPCYKMSVKENVYSVSLLYTFGGISYGKSKDNVYDDIRIEIVELPKQATPGDLAKAERDLRLERGEITTLHEKCEREIVEYSRKHPLIRIRMAWKESPSPIKHQHEGNEPMMHRAVTFARVRDIADSLKAKGIEGADLQLVGWNRSGHDGRFPQLFPVEPMLGGEAELRKTIEYVKSLGYKISLHISTLDAYELADNFKWNDITVKADGTYLQRGDFGGGLPYIVCPKKQREINKKHLEKIKALGVNGMHYTDEIAIIPPDSCFSEEHPCTEKEGIKEYLGIMKDTKEALGGFSSEGTYDFSIPELDYGLYVCFGDGFGARNVSLCDSFFPFFELAYHGIILYNPMSPTVNYTIKGNRERLYFFLRGGRPSFYIYSRFKANGDDWMGHVDLECDSNESLDKTAEAVLKGAKEYKAFADRQLTFMKDYVVLGDGLEAAIYEDGVTLVGNFSEEDKTYMGKTVPAGDFIVIK